MIRYLARHVSHDINIFPNKRGLLNFFSPCTIMNRRNFSVKTECQHEPVDFVISFQDNKVKTNTPMPRGVECIYLNPTKDLQEGYELMNFWTGELINKPVIKAALMPNWTIRRVVLLGSNSVISRDWRNWTIRSGRRRKRRCSNWKRKVEISV